MLKVAINGFGRIGRSAFKVALERFSQEVEIVGINDLTSPQTLAHLLKYDTAYGIWEKAVAFDENASTALSTGNLIVENKKYPVLKELDPVKLPWKDLNVEVVIESTGKFTDKEGASQHLQAGAKKVVISAPAKHTSKERASGGTKPTFEVDDTEAEKIPTLILGVNGDKYAGEKIVSNASCTTNCIAPVVEVINQKFGVLKAVMTTVHAYTHDQSLQDGPHKDLRRARAAAANMVPTSTGAAKATTETIPALKGLFDGMAIRVPVLVGSISDITFLLGKKVTAEEINQALTEAAEGSLKNILAVTSEPIVSADIVGRSESAIADLGLTQVVDGDLVKVFAWYDNEWGYSNRLIEQVINVGKS